MSRSLAIHLRPGSFSDRWAERAGELGVPFAFVDCLSSGIVAELAQHDALLFHTTHTGRADLLVGRHVIRAAELLGLLVFPSTATCWSFDDKVAQKYQLEAVGAPLARTDCFFTERAALDFVERADFPRVLKLRRGAGSTNVQLLRTRAAARAAVRHAFGRGFRAGTGGSGALPHDAGLRLSRARARGDLWGVFRRFPRTLLDHWRSLDQGGRERGYVYFQEFLPGNAFDVRVTAIGGRAFAFTRNVRRGDFRASGSGNLDYDQARVPPECLRIAFDVARKLGSQSAAFDFAFDEGGAPRILEVSFGYLARFVHSCPGYWDERLSFVEGHFWPQDAILEDLLLELDRRGGREQRG